MDSFVVSAIIPATFMYTEKKEEEKPACYNDSQMTFITGRPLACSFLSFSFFYFYFNLFIFIVILFNTKLYACTCVCCPGQEQDRLNINSAKRSLKVISSAVVNFSFLCFVVFVCLFSRALRFNCDSRNIK